MAQSNQALKVALDAVEKLPVKLRLELAERVMESVKDDEETLLVRFRWLSAKKQARLRELLDKNNEAILTPAEKLEMGRLVEEHDEIVLRNSEAMARISNPELFDKRGRLVKSRLKAALKALDAKDI
jgi:hypothetical protein